MSVIILKKVVFRFGIIFAANLTTYEDVLHRCLNLKRFQHRRDPSMLDRARSLPITMAITMAIHSIHLDFIRYLSQARRFHIFFCWAVFLPTHFFCRSPLGSILRQPFGFFQSWMFAHLLLFRSHSSSLHYQTVLYCIYSRTTASSPTFGFFQSNEQSLRSAIFKWVATISSVLQSSNELPPTFGFFQSWMFAHLLLFRSHFSSLHCQTVFYCFHSRTTATSPTFTISSLCRFPLLLFFLFSKHGSRAVASLFRRNSLP